MNTWRRLAVPVLLVITACGPVTAPESPLAPPTGKLAAWRDFPAAHSPRPIVLLDGLPLVSTSAFRTGDTKMAVLCNRFGPPVIPLPTEAPAQAHVRWPNGTSASYPSLAASDAYAATTSPPSPNPARECSSVAPLSITGVRLGMAGFVTDRGTAQMPAWLFAVPAAPAELAYPAVAFSAYWGGLAVPVARGTGATLGSAGRTLIYGFGGAPPGNGPCQGEYTGDVAEFDTVVAVSVRAIAHPSMSPNTACTAIGYERHVTLRLARPLGGRVVVDADGLVVEVT
jgi:hypothetical protein